MKRAIFRLREWFRLKPFPLEIIENEGAYRFHGADNCAIRIGLPKENAIQDFFESRLRQVYQDKAFSAAEAHSTLGAPKRSVQRKLTELTGDGKLLRLGAGSKIFYRFSG